DGQRVLDVREGAIEDPEVVVQGPRVEDLDDRLDVGAVEEPEVARVARESDGLPGARVALEVRPGRLDAEPTSGETERGGVRRAGGRALPARRQEGGLVDLTVPAARDPRRRYVRAVVPRGRKAGRAGTHRDPTRALERRL